MTTPTPLDLQWLQQQLHNALAPGAQAITLPRSTVELMACALAAQHSAQVPALASRYDISAEELRPAVIAELQRLANQGEAPSKRRFDIQRQRHLPTAQHICRILRESWPSLVQAAGLQFNRYARRNDLSGAPAGIEEGEPEPEPDIVQADDYDGYTVLRTRTEVVTAGNIRTTREYHMLR